MKDLQGKLLIAAPSLEDPNFARAVVLLVRHNEEGALGVIINRPLETSVKEAIGDAVEEPFDSDGVLHQGGPCESTLMVIHTQEYAGEAEVLPGVFFSVERDKVEWLLKNEDDEESIKYFVGYAGWGAGQLEAELATGSWLLADADEEILFGDPDDLWSRLLTAATLGQWIKPHQMPDDPSVN
jgi:putative transcriptional regulator